ncbi:MAG: arsenate reductase ArsC [Anaerolineae bacterium]|nr:arsenate reductase ArsC [Anaerolineae bacterium]
MKKIRVLFLCTANSARSQMAEAILRHLAGDHFEPYSAGLEIKGGVNPYTIKVLKEIGIDTTPLYAKPLTDFMGKVHFGYLITVCSQADKKCPSTFPGMGQRLHWGFEDPAAFDGSDEQKLEKFRQIRDEITAKIKTWLSELKIPVQS